MRRHPRWTRLIGVGLALLAVGIGPVAARTDRRPTPPPVSVQVQYGDSLWTLAREYGDPRQDVRAIVLGLTRENRLRAGELTPGQWLRIPADCLPSPAR